MAGIAGRAGVVVAVPGGPFHLDDYIAYVEEFIRHIGAEKLHVISVCQPTVPVLGHHPVASPTVSAGTP